MQLKTYPKSAGFTLIEMMVVVVMIAIATALGIPSYRAWMQNTQIYNAAESIQNGLQKAKSEAVKQNTNVQFVLSFDSNTNLLSSPPWIIQLPSSAVIEASTSEGAKNIITSVTPGGATTVTFNNLGGIVDPNPGANTNNVTASLKQIQFDSAFSGKVSGIRKLQVTIGVGGNTRMCDPDTTLAAADPRKC
jgi:type IV fimbrial biogenesis protein FimT